MLAFLKGKYKNKAKQTQVGNTLSRAKHCGKPGRQLQNCVMKIDKKTQGIISDEGEKEKRATFRYDLA